LQTFEWLLAQIFWAAWMLLSWLALKLFWLMVWVLLPVRCSARSAYARG
jgi:hypothetical protein